MGEAQKTAAFVGVALVLGVVAVISRPKQEIVGAAPMVGKPLFEKFSDPSKAASMEIVRYAEDVGEVHNFEVAKNQSGAWTIPSHGNYPADAQDQMKEAATSLIGVTVLDVASEDSQDHQLYGVVEPNKEKLKVGDKGVGLLVAFRDEKGDPLARLIVGQQVKGTTDQRFVRVPGQDAVYVAKVSTEKLSTKFEDWIEKDLLKLNVLDVERLRLKDYSVVPTVDGYAMQPRSDITVSLNATDGKWNLDQMLIYKGPEAQPSQLLEGEELDKEKLDALKNALGDVKIVDVYRKPKGLGATLKASGDFAKDAEARRSLESRGFILNPKDNELLAANGELHALTKEGVEYVLRFGNVAGEEEGSASGKLNRYLFVTARVDESRFPPPELTPEPGQPAASAADPVPAAPQPASPQPPAAPSLEGPAAPAAPGGAEAPPASSETPAAPSDAPAAEAAPSETPDSGCEPQDEAAQNEQPAENPSADGAAQSSSPAPQQPAEPAPPASSEKPAGDAPPAAAPAAAAKPAEQSSDADLQKKKQDAERDRIRKENQRKMDEWKEKKEKAEQSVAELNARFADWYYVISEDVYKKLHLSRTDIIKEGEKAAEQGTGLDAFRKLEKEGLKKPSPPSKPASPSIPE